MGQLLRNEPCRLLSLGELMTNDTDGAAYGQPDGPAVPGQQPFASPGSPPHGSSSQPLHHPLLPRRHTSTSSHLFSSHRSSSQRFSTSPTTSSPSLRASHRHPSRRTLRGKIGPAVPGSALVHPFPDRRGIAGSTCLGQCCYGNGESILIFIGMAALLTGIYSLIFKRPSWAALPSKQAAIVVAVAGAASLFLGVVAAGTEAVRDSAVAAAPGAAPQGPSTIQEGIIQDGTWIVGKDIAPGTYRTTNEVTGSCSWQITRPGSIDSSEGAVTSGFPMVKLVRGQRFISEGCGGWAKL